MRAYIDSDILIWHLRGHKQALDFFSKIGKRQEYEMWIGAMQRAEIVFFMRPGEEEETLRFLSQFKTEKVDQEIIDKAGEYYHRWSPSHGIDINDAILAPTAIKTGGKIYCLNTKHYPIPNLIVEKGW